MTDGSVSLNTLSTVLSTAVSVPSVSSGAIKAQTVSSFTPCFVSSLLRTNCVLTQSAHLFTSKGPVERRMVVLLVPRKAIMVLPPLPRILHQLLIMGLLF